MAKTKSKQSKGEKNSSRVNPLGDRVLIREVKKETGGKTLSGIYIPETVGEDRGARKGEVVAVGKGRYDDGELIPMSVKVGDTVLYQWGDKITIDGEEYEMVAEGSILAIIK